MPDEGGLHEGPGGLRGGHRVAGERGVSEVGSSSPSSRSTALGSSCNGPGHKLSTPRGPGTQAPAKTEPYSRLTTTTAAAAATVTTTPGRRLESQTSTGRTAAPRRAPTEPPIDSLTPASISPPCGVGWGPLRRLVPTGRVRKGHGEGYWLYGFVGAQAGVSRPNSEGWCQRRAGTFTWRHGSAEMGGEVGGWRGWCCPHPPSSTEAGVKSLVWRK